MNVQSRFHPGTRRGFTLIEILVVVVILGIIAAIVMPQFSNASQVARENTLKDDLRYLRSQIIVYQVQHQDSPPTYVNGTISGTAAAMFLSQMTQYTDVKGNCNATQTGVYAYGPYLTKMPPNPLSSVSTIKVVTGIGSMAADGTTGWIFNPDTQTIIANSTASDSSGVAYSAY